MHPGDVPVRAVVHLHAVRPQALDAPRDVLALEADEIDALAVAGEEAADRRRRIRRLEQLDVADPGGQDRVLEAELLRLRAAVDGQAEEPRVARDRGLQVPHDDRQLDDVAQHGSPPWVPPRYYHPVREKRWALSLPVERPDPPRSATSRGTRSARWPRPAPRRTGAAHDHTARAVPSPTG